MHWRVQLSPWSQGPARPAEAGGDQIIGGLKPQGLGRLKVSWKPHTVGQGGARFVPGPRRGAASQSWLESLLCSRGLRAASARPAALGDSIATAWESHKTRAGGEKAGGKQERGTKQGEGTRKDSLLQERGGKGFGGRWELANKNRGEVNKGTALGKKEGEQRNNKR